MRRGLLCQWEEKMGKNQKKKARINKRIWKLAGGFAAITLAVSLILLVLVYFDVLPIVKDKPSESFLSDAQILRQDTELLGQGLELQGVGRYCGVYMEDGSMDQVSDVMMIRLKNTTQQDLQLAKLSLVYEGFTAEFEITNLPAGRTVIALEKNRNPFADQKYLSMSLSNVVFFEENMDAAAGRYQLTGMDGALNLKNVSANDISGDIYIYYKYIAAGELYGGVTFRAKLPGGVKAGEMRQAAAEHFDPDSCLILAVTSGA